MKDFISKDAAMTAVRKMHIGLDSDGETAMHVKRLLEKGEDGNVLPKARRFTNNDETRGMMLIGAPGSGKSHLMHRTLAKIPELAAGEDGVPRFISVSVPSPATLKSVTLALLKKTGYHHGGRRQEVWALWEALLHRLNTLGICLVWIDEAQDLFCADRKMILRALKSLMSGDEGVAVVVSGTEDLDVVIRSDQQVKRRFTSKVLPELVQAVDGEMFQEIMADYCPRVGLGAPIEADLVGRVFHGARYRFGRAMELLLDAMEFAIERDAEHLTIDHFASAYAMNEACTASENVFYADSYQLLDPDGEAMPVLRRKRQKRGG